MNENNIQPHDENEAGLMGALRTLAEATRPQPEFAAQLEAELLARWEPRPAQDAPSRKIHLPNLWRKPMFKRLSLMLAGAAALALALVFVLPLLFGGSKGPLAPLPLLADQPELAGEFQAGRPLGALGDVELVLEADLPRGPTEAPVYRQAIGALPTTPEDALAWAERFHFSDPKVYRDVRDPNTLIVMAGDGQTLTFQPDAPWAISYAKGLNPFLGWRPGDPDTAPPPSFEEARDAAIAFLREHDLLPDAYQVEEEGHRSVGVESPPIRQILIRPLLDVYPLEGQDMETRVQVGGPDGRVYSVRFSPLPALSRGESYPLRSAEEAFEALRAGNVKGPFRLSIDWYAPAASIAEASQITYYRPEQTSYQAGDLVSVRGYVLMLRAVKTDELRATLVNNDGTFELAGPAVEEMATELSYNEVVVQGTIEAELGSHRWRLAVDEWSLAPPLQATRLLGTIEEENGITFLLTDNGVRYRLLAPPDGLSAGQRAAVYAEIVQTEGEEPPALRWSGIESPPATPQYISGGSEGVSVMVEEVVVVTPPAGYQPRVSPFQIGDEIEVEGMAGATIYVNREDRRVEAWFRVGLGPDYELDYRLSGPPELLEELAQYDGLHLRLRARVIPDEEWHLGQGLEVIGFEKIWPAERVQGFLGTLGVETLDGRKVVVFSDKESGQRYVLFSSLSERFNPDEYVQYIVEDTSHTQLFLAGVVRPDQTFAGLPVIEAADIRTGSDVDAATSADQLPLGVPQVVDESRMRRLTGRAIVDRVELAYYATSVISGEQAVAEVPEFSLIQPVWVFHGHTEDGQATFRAYVQAVEDEYLQ